MAGSKGGALLLSLLALCLAPAFVPSAPRAAPAALSAAVAAAPLAANAAAAWASGGRSEMGGGCWDEYLNYNMTGEYTPFMIIGYFGLTTFLTAFAFGSYLILTKLKII
ncbi:unnamed protein product [Effrenium voratum]|nr:unnamed protein product [Effrenium voratum]